jgi:hypothetical protein
MLKIERSLHVSPVWAGHPVGFDLLTHGDRQFVAFYDDQRRMTVAARRLGSEAWTYARLPTSVGWDSHNYVTMAVDAEGQIHLSGNMHCVPLIYFRTARPLDIDSFQKVEAMVGRNEEKCTYPYFIRGAQGELIFRYRDGKSGNGVEYYNVYDPGARTWRRLIEGPLTDGQGRMNAYPHGPVQDRDGVFHLCWVWRDTPDCSTNHDLSYARSRDLVRWESSRGRAFDLPITVETGEVVDPVPPQGGIINGNAILGFDSRNRPILTYHKYDASGHTQVYNARLEADGWRIYQTSDWTFRWAFSGGGAIVFEVRLGGVRVEADGGLSLSYWNAQEGPGIWRLDEATLRPVGAYPSRPDDLPPEMLRVESEYPGMEVQTCRDSGPGTHHALRWETLGYHRDRAREQAPPPTELRLYELSRR